MSDFVSWCRHLLVPFFFIKAGVMESPSRMNLEMVSWHVKVASVQDTE